MSISIGIKIWFFVCQSGLIPDSRCYPCCSVAIASHWRSRCLALCYSASLRRWFVWNHNCLTIFLCPVSSLCIGPAGASTSSLLQAIPPFVLSYLSLPPQCWSCRNPDELTAPNPPYFCSFSLPSLFSLSWPNRSSVEARDPRIDCCSVLKLGYLVLGSAVDLFGCNL